MLIIDCHAHVYGEDEKKYPPIDKPNRPPKGTGTPARLLREMDNAGVRYVTAIQTTTFYRWDNRFTIATARANPDRMVAVCTLDPDDPHSPGLLEQYVREGGVRGMRSIPATNRRLDHPGVAKLWETAQRLGIVINAFVSRDYAKELSALLTRFPRLRVVLDHCFTLRAGPELEKTITAAVEMARHPNLHAKLTFIPGGSREAYPCRDMHDACRAVIKAYTPQRCVWGSDFPCELWCPKVSYARHLKIFTDEMGLDRPTQEAVLGKTAHALWFADRKTP